MGVGQIQGDLADAEAVRHAINGVDAVFHNAAKAGAWGSYEELPAGQCRGNRECIGGLSRRWRRQVGLHLHTERHPPRHSSRGRPGRQPGALWRRLPGALCRDQGDRRACRARRQWRGPGHRRTAAAVDLGAGRPADPAAPGRARARWATAVGGHRRKPRRFDLHRQRRASALRRFRPSRRSVPPVPARPISSPMASRCRCAN